MPLPARRRGAALVLASLVLAGGLAGCAGDAQPAMLPGPTDTATGPAAAGTGAPASNGAATLDPADVLARATAALAASPGFRVVGDPLGGGAVDIAFAPGTGSTGTVETSAGPVAVVGAAGRVYVQGDAAALAAVVGADAAATVAGKWLLLPVDAGAYAVFADAQAFTAPLLNPQGQVERTSVTEVDGSPAVGLRFAASGATLWVTAEGDLRPLRYEQKGAVGDQGVLRFADWGLPPQVSVPAPDSVYDVANPPAVVPAEPAP